MGQSCSSLAAKRWRSIGPSSWLAVYRSSVLRVLAPFDERLDAHYIDVDIALSMLELGLKSCVDPEFVATVDTEAPIVAEAKCPHGRSAQRAIQRFANHQKSTMLGNCVSEILQIPLRPWKFSHLLQRLGARKTLRFDGDFARRLAVAAAEECWATDDREQQGQTAARKRAA
jgi:hypothetical protein